MHVPEGNYRIYALIYETKNLRSGGKIIRIKASKQGRKASNASNKVKVSIKQSKQRNQERKGIKEASNQAINQAINACKQASKQGGSPIQWCKQGRKGIKTINGIKQVRGSIQASNQAILQINQTNQQMQGTYIHTYIHTHTHTYIH